MTEVEAQAARERCSAEDAIPESEADDRGLESAAARIGVEGAAEHRLHYKYVVEVGPRRDGEMTLDDRPGLHRCLEVGEGGNPFVRVHLVADDAVALIARQRLPGIAAAEPRPDDALSLGVRDVRVHDSIGQREDRRVEREREA